MKCENLAELQRAINIAISNAIDDATLETFNRLQVYLNRFYTNSGQPTLYRRTYQLRNSAKTEVERLGNQHIGTIYLDYDSVNYDNSNRSTFQNAGYASYYTPLMAFTAAEEERPSAFIRGMGGFWKDTVSDIPKAIEQSFAKHGLTRK